MFQFREGDKVVYPAQGVAEITGTETRDIGGEELDFYVLNIIENNMRVMVPMTNVEQVGVRSIMSEDQADNVFNVLKKREKICEGSTWSRRHREYMEKVKTGSAEEVARVLRDLYVLKADKELSFGERKMLDRAKSLLVHEISISKGIPQDEVESRFQEIFQV